VSVIFWTTFPCKEEATLKFSGDDRAVDASKATTPLAIKGGGGKWFRTLIKSSWEKMDRAKLEFFRGTLDVLVLKALVWGPLHGYAITTLIRRQSDDALLLEEGTLYPALWRLESKGLLEGEWGLSENNRRAKFYSLTLDGRRELREETKIWQAYAAAVAKVLSATQPPLSENAS
jgi:transcriptional regulator